MDNSLPNNGESDTHSPSAENHSNSSDSSDQNASPSTTVKREEAGNQQNLETSTQEGTQSQSQQRPQAATTVTTDERFSLSASVSASNQPAPDTPSSIDLNHPSTSVKHRGRAQYQLVFDDTSSEASITSSPAQSVEPSTPVLQYLAQQNYVYPNSPVGNKSHDLDLMPGDLASVSHDLDTESHDGTSSTGGDENVSVYSGSTLVADDSNKANKEKGVEESSAKEDSANNTAKKSESHHLRGISPDSNASLEDVTLVIQSASTSSSSSPVPKPKVHPLSVLTSDSEVEGSPPYSPGPYLSGDEELSGNVKLPNMSPHSTPSPLGDQPAMSVLFSGVTYLGSSSVDAPISEVEANRKMFILKQQAAMSEPIPVILSIPMSNEGSVMLKDPQSEQPLATFQVKMILFCARGNAHELVDCFCLNVRHKRSGIYHCHVFKCGIPEACHKIFEAIGKAFKTKSVDNDLPPLTGEELSCFFDVSVDLYEDDGKGTYVIVKMDKDCFKLRTSTRKKVVLTVSQPNTERPLVIERCFGLLISPGKDVKGSEMNLLDNMKCNDTENSFIVAGIWETSIPFLASLNEETPKSVRHQHLTIAADLVLECVTEPVRFKREVKVHVSKGGSMGYLMSTLTKKKQKNTEVFRLKLKKSEGNSPKGAVYSVVELVSVKDIKEPDSAPPSSVSNPETGRLHLSTSEDSATPGHTPSPRVKLKNQISIPGTGQVSKVKAQEEQEDSDAVDDENDVLVSGWGDSEDMREDLLKDWGELLEKWDGKDRSRSGKLIKLCRKGIPRHLRCQVWQMLTGAAYDPQLHEAYRLLLSKDSPAENVISWDIKRTYVGHNYFQESNDGRDALYKICKAYSVYDEEVGYCQGFSFMAAVMLLQKMPEEQAFGVLVKIMYNYNHRAMFKTNFQNLHLMLYQLDRLLEENITDLYQHFQANRIEAHMYASQWFLTLYTAKFPLSIVFRILDIYLCERISLIFRVALALLKMSRKDLLSLDFEGILNYFRVSLPKKFQSEEECQQLFHVVFSFKGVNDKKLSKLEKDHQSFLEQQAQMEDPVMRLERENKQLRDTIIRLEQENDNLAQELVISKVTLRTEMDRLEERIDTLSKEGRAHKTSSEASQILIGELREELQQAKQEYQKVMMQLMEEKQQHQAAVAEYKQVFQQIDEGHQKQKEELSQELLEVKAKLGSGDTEVTDRHSSLTSEERLRKLELELAQTKLALVESQCKNQELEHKVVELSSSAARTRNWGISLDFGSKKK